MKKYNTEIARATLTRALVLATALVLLSGCASSHNKLSGKSWSQTAEKEERTEQQDSATSGDFIG